MNTKIATFAFLCATNEVWGLKVKDDSFSNLESAISNSKNDELASKSFRRSKYCFSGYGRKGCYCSSSSDSESESLSDQCDAIMSFGYKNIFASSTVTPDFINGGVNPLNA